MNQVEKYARLTEQLQWVKARIDKVRLIMNIPDQDLQTESIKSYREKMLRELTLLRQQLEFDLEDLIDEIHLEHSVVRQLIFGL